MTSITLAARGGRASFSSSRLKRFLADTAGTTSMVFMMTLIPSVAVVGMMTDYGRSFVIKQEMQQALDAAALVGGRTFDATGNMNQATQAAQTYFVKILPSSLRAKLASVKTDAKGNVTMTANSSMKTTFLGAVGISTLPINANVKSLSLDSSQAGAGKNIEVALVMDVTGSMADNNKLINAKAAATALVNTLLPVSGQGANSVRISIVPFAEYVNVGTYAPAATNTPISVTSTSTCMKPAQTQCNFQLAGVLCTQQVGYAPDRQGTPRDHDGCDRGGYKPDNQGVDRDLDGFNRHGYKPTNNWGHGDWDGGDRGWGQHYVQQDVDANGFDHFGLDQDGYDVHGWDQYGCDGNGDYHGSAGKDTTQWNGYAAKDKLNYQYDRQTGRWFDQHGHDQWGYDRNGFDDRGFNSNGYSQAGFDHHLCDHTGHDQNGRDVHGRDQNGYDLAGRDRHGYDQTDYDQNGFDRHGCDHSGKDKYGNQIYGSNAFPVTTQPPKQVSTQTICSTYANTPANPYPCSTGQIATTCSSTSYLQGCVAERMASTGHAYDDAAPNSSSSYFHPFMSTNIADQLTCPKPAPAMTPLTNNRTTLLTQIASLTANGGTSGHIGTAWGWYALSPNWSSFWNAQAPGSAPAPAGNVMKIAIIMTDGGYNLHYGQTYNQVNDDTTANAGSVGNGLSRDQALQVCTGMKNAGIEVFTIGVEVAASVNDGKASDAAAVTTLQQCSSNADAKFATHFYNIVDNNDPTTGLVATFSGLAKQIANVTGTGNQTLRMTQ